MSHNRIVRVHASFRNRTSPNHKAYIAVTVHFEQNGVPLCLLLDLVGVAKSHSGTHLAAAFAKILDDFGIGHKVSPPLNSDTSKGSKPQQRVDR